MEDSCRDVTSCSVGEEEEEGEDDDGGSVP